jgi:hypothetical protein
MIDLYSGAGILAHELPIRYVVDCAGKMDLAWVTQCPLAI